MSSLQLRAPKEHGQILAVPPLDQVGALMDRNQRNLYSGSRIISRGAWFYELLTLARQEILAASTQYHQEAGEPVFESKREPWLVAGHQPEIFHPGVWFKNFALHQLARRHGAMSLNLIIDTDAAGPALLHAPAESRVASVPFDRSNMETPYEERKVEDESIFADLPERMAPLVAGWGFEPMLGLYWKEVLKQVKRTPLLGERLASARRALERRWGVVQREVPMSRVCQTKSFAWFACSIVSQMPAIHALYNKTVVDYRRAHGIRTRSRPVPELTVDGDWLEAPFWAWRIGQARRGKLFVRCSNGIWALRRGDEEWPGLPLEFEPMVKTWHALEARGFKIRSRALTTTMFARLFLADIFIHGIGGGLYDELTDRLIEGYQTIHGNSTLTIPAPGYLVLSATLHLPLPRYPDAVQQARDLERQRRDLIYKPELIVEPNASVEPLIRAKQEWIRRGASTHAERVERFERIRAINARLAPFVQPKMRAVQVGLEECQREMAWDAVTGRRDYAFCLYPEEMLRAFFTAQMCN